MALHPLVLKYKPWSVSKLGVLEGCARQFHWKHVERRKEQGSSGAAKVGVAVHAVIEDRLAGKQEFADDALLHEHAVKQALTSDEIRQAKEFLPSVDEFVERINRFEEKKRVSVRRMEHKLGLREDFSACDFMAGDCVIRGVIDYLAVPDKGTVVVLDHKTGKRKSLEQHRLQLHTYKLFVAAHFPEAAAVQCGIHYVGDPELDWEVPMPLSYVRSHLFPWLEMTLNKQVVRLSVIDENRAAPQTGWRCEYCGYIEDCREGQEEVARRQARRGNAP